MAERRREEEGRERKRGRRSENEDGEGPSLRCACKTGRSFISDVVGSASGGCQRSAQRSRRNLT
eukprot:768411-Hanusia_phi.AAC.6